MTDYIIAAIERWLGWAMAIAFVVGGAIGAALVWWLHR